MALAYANAHEPTKPAGIHEGFETGLEMDQQIMLRQFGWTAEPDVFSSLIYMGDPRMSIRYFSPKTGPVKVYFLAAGYVVSAV